MSQRALVFSSPLLALGLLVSCSSEPDHGPFWEHEKVSPAFSVQQDNIATSFSGHVYQETRFVFGPEDGVLFTTDQARLTIDAAAVWAYAPIRVALYSGSESDVGSADHLVASWVVEEPQIDGKLLFVESRTFIGTPSWVVIDFEDFSGQCVFQILGHH